MVGHFNGVPALVLPDPGCFLTASCCILALLPLVLIPPLLYATRQQPNYNNGDILCWDDCLHQRSKCSGLAYLALPKHIVSMTATWYVFNPQGCCSDRRVQRLTNCHLRLSTLKLYSMSWVYNPRISVGPKSLELAGNGIRTSEMFSRTTFKAGKNL